LLICDQVPYPCVNGGIARLVADYEADILCDFDVYLLHYRYDEDDIQLYHHGQPVPGPVCPQNLLTTPFALVILFNYDTDFQQDSFIRPFLTRFPCFHFLQTHPVAGMDDGCFRGILAQSSSRPHEDVFSAAGFYKSDIFLKRKERREELVVCIARIHEDKNQLELVRGYKEQIYQKYGFPLYLVGGGGVRHGEDTYFHEVMRFVDGSSVIATADPGKPLAADNWLTSKELAALLHRARLSVIPSPRESLCITLLESLACGTTCVVNGEYRGFRPEQLAPHVFGYVTGKQGSILDSVAAALKRNARIDGSAWARQFSLAEVRPRLQRFIQERCG
jgi:glycosyltransferase involved in cell wall biosynthesis